MPWLNCPACLTMCGKPLSPTRASWPREHCGGTRISSLSELSPAGRKAYTRACRSPPSRACRARKSAPPIERRPRYSTPLACRHRSYRSIRPQRLLVAGLSMVVLGILVGGTWAAVKLATDHLLYQNATSAASEWARYLADNVADLEQIAAGERPSVASLAFFQGARKAGHVFRYVIFNREGYSQLVSQHDKIALVELSEYSADAARSVQTDHPVVDVKEGGSLDFPWFFAQAYIPIRVDGHPIAVVADDGTQRRKRPISRRYAESPCQIPYRQGTRTHATDRAGGGRSASSAL
jgi:hypothetical protein